MRIILLTDDGYDVEAQFLHNVSDLDIRVGSSPKVSHFTDIDSIFRVGDFFFASCLHLHEGYSPTDLPTSL